MNKHIVRTGEAAAALAVFFAATVPVAQADVIDESLGDAILSSLGNAFESVGSVAGVDAVSALHSSLEAAITAPDAQQLLADINLPTVELFGRELVGNGLNVGDPIPGLPGETFTGTNDGLLTPYLNDVGINPGNMSDGGFLLGDHAQSSDPTNAQVLPPINCTATILPPTVDGAFLIAPAVGACDGPATIALSTEMYYDSIFPVGLPGFGVGVGGTDTTTAALCFPGFYSAYMLAGFFYPPGYTTLTPDPVDAVSTADILAC